MSRHTIFVTGATGFIGSHLIPRLAEAGHALRCLVRAGRDPSPLEALGASIVEGGVEDREALARGMVGCDRVIHLAARYSFWERDPSVFERVNVEGTRNTLECALEAGTERVVYVSTTAIWGHPETVLCDETTPYAPTRPSAYARSKYEAERVAADLRAKGLPLVVLLPSGVTGPGDSKASGEYLHELATGRLPARAAEPHYVTYVHVRDVVDAIERVLDHPGAVGERYIVAAAALTVGEINAIVRDVTGVRLPLLKIPDWLALLAAHALTWIADRIGRAPPWGMASDQIRMMVAGFRCDGSKAAKELDLQYTPVPIAFEEALRTTPPEAFPASGGEP